ncbi:MAG: carboxypeptidase M32 [Bacilli bacterium]
MNKDLQKLYSLLSQMEVYSHAGQIINYDLETAAPKGGMSDDARDMSEFSSMSYKIAKSKEYIGLVSKLYKTGYDKLNIWDKKLVKELYKEVQKSRYVDIKTQKEATTLYNNSYIIWAKAKEDNNYQEFEPTLNKVYKMQKKLLLLRKNCDKKNLYNTLFDDYEEGFTTVDLDKFFDDLEKGIVPLLNKVRAATYVPRHDFLTRKVSLNKQEEFTKEILKFNGFDFNRGSVSTTIHPFTEQFGPNDVRVTTHYYETNFISNMYSIIHEGGHALFGQNIPKEVYTHHLGEGFLSMAKHESVSRFYENVIGRSKEYIQAIYPAFLKIFATEMGDVSINDFYEGVNYVDLNNPLRTEADELTYSLHIIIRYRLEREIMSGKADFKTLNQEWNRLYKKILGIDNKDDKTGILQDVHWASGFGYFPTYSLGNALNCIYVKALDKDIDLKKTVLEGHMDLILKWMKDNVFKKAALLNTKKWIKDISGEEFSAQPYVDYLTNKYTEIYHLK